jgi:threonine dehydrogenase-like Zn-dependent dehydrogenase
MNARRVVFPGPRQVLWEDFDPAGERLEIARRLGTHHVLPLPVDEAWPEVLQLSKNRGIEPERVSHDGGADCVFEVTGNPAVVAGAVGLARRAGQRQGSDHPPLSRR